MAYRYEIHPSVGVARLGNSRGAFYLAPETIGGLPTECDAHGNPILVGGKPIAVAQFKDESGCIRRQGAKFRIFRYDTSKPGEPGTEVTLETEGVKAIDWTLHVANKKAAWWGFAELVGDLMLGEWLPDGQNTNSYEYQARQGNVSLNNPTVVGEEARRQLIIDPGPRSLSGANQEVEVSVDNIPPDYKFGSFPPQDPSQGTPITSLGTMITDAEGRLVFVGAYGAAGGDQPIGGFSGANSWNDDTCDGQIWCHLQIEDTEVDLGAWVVAGSPKFAPELVNIVSLDDIMFDVGVQYLGLIPDMCKDGIYNPAYIVNFERDIRPIIERPRNYMWVANVQSMMAFTAPPFDPRDNSPANLEHRRTYFSYFRKTDEMNRLWSDGDNSLPLMPLNSGSNSVSNLFLQKFLTLTNTQYFMLSQWANGQFENGPPAPLPGVDPLDVAAMGNCVGGPMCPGIEVTWSTRNPTIYSAPYVIRPEHDEEYYQEHGLTPMRDECFGGGCQPGDLTKRMAIPWQADFFQCTIQFINYTNPAENQTSAQVPIPPTYYGYWWPVQSPMFVLSGPTTIAEQQAAGVPAGYQVYYARGINSFAQMVNAWSYLGFVINTNHGPQAGSYPYFAETERAHDKFGVVSFDIGNVDNFSFVSDELFWPAWYLKDPDALTPEKAAMTGVGGARGRVTGPARGHMHHGRLPIRRR